MDFWCDTGVPQSVWAMSAPAPGNLCSWKQQENMAPAWAELSLQPSPAFPGRALWSHLLEREVSLFPHFPVTFAYFFLLLFTSPKWPFFPFLGKEEWPVFSYLPWTWPHKSWDIHKARSSFQKWIWFFGEYNPFGSRTALRLKSVCNHPMVQWEEYRAVIIPEACLSSWLFEVFSRKLSIAV